MSETEALKRLDDLERQTADVLRRMEVLRAKIRGVQDSPAARESDEIASRLARLYSMVVGLFPEAIFRFEGALIIPGVAGAGELGPGNVQYPNFSVTTGHPLEAKLNRRTRLTGGGDWT